MTEATTLTSGSLIAAGAVKGSIVYDLAGEKLGDIDDIMIDKASGRAIYAVMSFGGFLGVGENYYPLPWASLKYDARLDGYVVGLARAQLEAAPKYDRNTAFEWTPDFGRQVDQYYDEPSNWG
jgi:sporulation protein YlmC with PRC-barrel domain